MHYYPGALDYICIPSNIMKPSRYTSDRVRFQKWQFLDNCPVCQPIKRAILSGKRLTLKEFGRILVEAVAKRLA